jgi:hypothetical protein
MTSPAPAGWYADPSGLPALRWWDGQDWTSHVQPGASGAPPTTISAGWRGGPATKPSGSPLPGAHTVEAPTDLLAPTAPAAPSSAALSATQASHSGYAQSTAFLAQPVDSVSEQLGFTTPEVPTPDTEPLSPASRSPAIVGAVSLLVNPLLLCSIYAILMGLRGMKSPDPAAKRLGTLAAALGATGILTHAALIVLLITFL